MKIRGICCSRGETSNPGNFNSVRLEFSVTATIEDGESVDESYQKLRDWVLSRVQVEAAKHGKR